jgi:nitrate reductase beta subunit
VHVPTEFLEQIFGPQVQEVKNLYRSLKDDRKLLGAMMLFGATSRILTRFEVQGDEAVGWDVDDQEVARVPFTEPTYFRKHFDEKTEAYRHNTA